MRSLRDVIVPAALVSIALTCAAADPSGSGATRSRIPVKEEQAPAGLEVVHASQVRALSLEDIRRMPAIEGYGGIKSSTGKITPPSRFKGVAVEDLCRLVGGLDARVSVAIVASDGYEMTMPATQIAAGAFKAYDVGTGEERPGSGRLRLIVAYEMDGEPLDQTRDGSLRLGLVGPSPTLVTDGHWWIKWVVKIVVKPVVREWTLKLSGTIDEQVDRATFESCAAPKCHGARWTDSRGREWEGVPLFLLVGRIDDQKRHGSGAFNRTLNAEGYRVTLRGRDGREVVLDARGVGPDARLVVAHRRDGEPLSDEDGPLRLVGAGVTPNLDLSGIGDIRLLRPRGRMKPVR
jgi:DMSO/TMAO reductase YedYZ molybdopterin-dependent catalytic subunit